MRPFCSFFIYLFLLICFYFFSFLCFWSACPAIRKRGSKVIEAQLPTKGDFLSYGVSGQTDSSNTQTKAAQTCEAFPKADIPLHKLRHPAIKEFLEKNKIECPEETTCRNEVKDLYADKMEKLKEILKNKKTFVQCNESEVSDKKFVHVLVGDIGERPFFVTSNALRQWVLMLFDTWLTIIYEKWGLKNQTFSTFSSILLHT